MGDTQRAVARKVEVKTDKSTKLYADAGVSVGHVQIGTDHARNTITRSAIAVEVKIVSNLPETLSRLKEDITTAQKGKTLDQVKARIARTYIDKIKQEAASTNPNKEKMIGYLKSVQRITGYVTEKVTTAGKVVTTLGEAFNTVESLFGKK
jgi:hypothetical protein